MARLFMTQSERRREADRARRRAFRRAEMLIERNREACEAKKRERDAAWEDARAHLRAGQKAAAERSLRAVRTCEEQLQRSQSIGWTFERAVARLRMVDDKNAFGAALQGIGIAVQPDVAVAEAAAGALLDADEGELDTIWADIARQEERAGAAVGDAVPSLDQMMASLSAEVAAEVRSGVQGTAGALADEVAAGRQRLRAFLEEPK